MSDLIIGDDGLPASLVGIQAKKKHRFLSVYLDTSRFVRRGFLGPGKAGATFIDLFCGPGRSKIRDTGEWVDGSAVTAWRISQKSKTPFSAVYVADQNDECRKAAVDRLKSLGAPVHEIEGDALVAAWAIRKHLNPAGLHFAFIDPFNLESLDFQIFQALSSLKRIDLLVHVSAMDIRRNLGNRHLSDESAFDVFAPGWRNHVDVQRAHLEIRRRVVEYWRNLIAGLGISPSITMEPITGAGNQLLYWLVLAAKNELALKFWEAALKTNPNRTLPLPFNK